MRGSLRYASDDKTVRCFGRDDDFLGGVEENGKSNSGGLQVVQTVFLLLMFVESRIYTGATSKHL
jgi:hypothetical protein